ncbi:MAG: class C beta-lactamase-related serine hydrolase [Candidimonas sp.]|nr:MAG: class C beta-lactamase-related serine hydrolase [Candidimonas sp.]
MNDKLMEEAIRFSVDHESSWDREVTDNWGVHRSDPPPWNRLLGPVHSRGPNSGVVVLAGRTVASWGEPRRADLTFSIAKTYLSLLAGVAHDRGLLPDVHEPIRARLPGIGFDDGRNREVTWEHMLQQTSEWRGTCFGFSDQADHYRAVTFGRKPDGKKGDLRATLAPGSYWEYNDVRINQFSLALLHLFGHSLAEVFGEAIMRPVGATNDWRWDGYDNSWVEIKGHRVQSVPGGTHWGGGLSISAEDQARIGQMLLNGGRANGQRVLSAEWIERMRTPCGIAPYYGYLVWLNTDHAIFPSVPATSYFGIGAGSSFCWIEPEREMVVIIRWLDSAFADNLFKRILAAVDGD